MVIGQWQKYLYQSSHRKPMQTWEGHAKPLSGFAISSYRPTVCCGLNAICDYGWKNVSFTSDLAYKKKKKLNKWEEKLTETTERESEGG